MHTHTIISRAGSATVITEEPIEHLQQTWQRGEFFETRMLEYVYWHYKGGVFVDVGAALGNHSLFFAKFCAPKLVIAIEPVAASCERQRQIYALNDVERRVRIHNCAVSDKAGKGAMERFGSNLGQFRLKPGTDVFVETLDSIVAKEHAKPVRLVKIDVEGHELRVLKGAARLLDEQKPALFVEIRSRQRLASVTQFLAGFGYRQVGSVFQDATAFEFTAAG